MKKLLLAISLTCVSLSIHATEKEQDSYEALKPIASSIYQRSIVLVESIPDSYQSYKYQDDKSVWRSNKDESNTLPNDVEKLGDIWLSPFSSCISLGKSAGNLWSMSMANKGQMDPDMFKMYLTAKKDCKYQLDNLPEDKSNLRAVDL
ncbi:hypothetical protein GKR70_12205 [Providencia alcalifaciens]|uniref:hypothetical protein n=1 Tax=Providencia alcalifaciens TaxID=126385 RepID=UPI0012B559FE|nr:hypothetical protein [Providencia alcalifaciens]MTC39265.1 hypothetical protein [Providencia alcalifaciens]